MTLLDKAIVITIILAILILACPLLTSLAVLASYLMKPYSGICLLVGLPIFGLAIFALLIWRNPPKIALPSFDPDRRERELEEAYLRAKE